MATRFNRIGGGEQRKDLLLKWKEGRESIWNFTINESEFNRQILAQKWQAEVQLEQEK